MVPNTVSTTLRAPWILQAYPVLITIGELLEVVILVTVTVCDILIERRENGPTSLKNGKLMG